MAFLFCVVLSCAAFAGLNAQSCSQSAKDIDGTFQCGKGSGYSSSTGAYSYVNYCCCDKTAVLTGTAKANCAGTGSWTYPTFTCGSPAGSVCPILAPSGESTQPFKPPTAAANTVLFPVNKKEVVDMHNCIRRNVNPKACAGAMPALVWDNDLAFQVEQYTATCPGLNHYTPGMPNRTTNGISWKDGVGQNICVAQCKQSFSQCILNWAAEVANFGYGQGSVNGGVVGHYTQVVAARSTAVGCAYAFCPGQTYPYQQICNYGPAGNMVDNSVGGVDGTKSPYKRC